MFTKFGEHMCFDETKLKVNHKFVVSGQEKVRRGQNKIFNKNLKHPVYIVKTVVLQLAT